MHEREVSMLLFAPLFFCCFFLLFLTIYILLFTQR